MNVTEKQWLTANEILQRYWGYSSFRPKQEEIIKKLLEGKQVIGLLPTGGGKSLCYQVPALILEGFTIVISPLISLMEDQVIQLKSKGVAAECIHSGLSKGHADRVLDNCYYGHVRLLYVSPERLASSEFISRVKQCKVNLVAIDEAHCISQWGHDFRRAYLNIHTFLLHFPKSKILALTASATPIVVDEMITLLYLSEPVVVRDRFIRENIYIRINQSKDKLSDLISVCESVRDQKSIIYCRSRRNVEMISEMLINRQMKAAYYHAGMTYRDRKKIHESFSKGEFNIIVATNAFGMGIDISDIRNVIHYGLPPSVEEYYQEYGRAGRDQKPSQAILFYTANDISYLKSNFEKAYPHFDQVVDVAKKIYILFNIHVLEGSGYNFGYDLSNISARLGLSPRLVHDVVNVMQSLDLLMLIEQKVDNYLVKLVVDPRSLRDAVLSSDKKAILEYLMRRFEKIWDEYCDIDLSDLQKACDIQNAESHLMALSYSGFLKYHHISPGMRIVFTSDRLSGRDFRELEKQYLQIRKSKEDRIRSVTELIQTNGCRNKMILTYFGEEWAENCGHCDRCRPPENQVPGDITKLSKSELILLIKKAKREGDEQTLAVVQRLYNEGLLSIDELILNEL